jgi:uncharacterized protein YndB with AHSA1/START domain
MLTMSRRDISIEHILPHPPTEVWHALTDPAALEEWLMPVRGYAAVVGRRFELRARPMPGWDGVVNCEVLEVDAPRRLSFSWQGSRMRTRTTVTWTLTALPDGGTRLRLDHQGFTGAGGTILGFMHGSGWRKFVRTALPKHLSHSSNAGRNGSD